MPKTSRRLTAHPLTLREVEVVRVVNPTPGMRRITLSGERLREFTSANDFPQSAFDSPGFDDEVRRTDWLLVAGDAAAIPAIGRLLDELPDNARAQVFVEVAGDAHRLELRALPHVEVTWLVRDGAEAGTTSLLRDTVGNTDWWEGRPLAWIAGEHTAVRDPRRHPVEDRAVPMEDTVFISRALEDLPDPDAAHAPRRAAESLLPGGRVPLIEEVFDTGALDEHDDEADLLGLTTTVRELVSAGTH